ncbi:MAG: hypothetical protein KF797_06480, partial [Flavobacteriales bacterium]|nr:hypothetical protein [Flavobacteriales bacterium]
LLILWGVVLVIKSMEFARKLYPDWPRDKDMIGELHVDDDGLTLTQDGDLQHVLFQDVRSAILEHNHIKGEALSHRDITHNGIATLSLTFHNGHAVTIKFLIAGRDQVPGVEFLLRGMYKRSIEVKEFVGRLRLRTILFKLGRSFKEIQALKEELGVKHFH